MLCTFFVYLFFVEKRGGNKKKKNNTDFKEMLGIIKTVSDTKGEGGSKTPLIECQSALRGWLPNHIQGVPSFFVFFFVSFFFSVHMRFSR